MTTAVEPDDYPALALFRAWVDLPGNSQAGVAKALGVSGPSVNAWYTGTSRPRGHLRAALAALTGGAVPEPSWERPSEREARERALERIAAGSESREGAA